MSNADGRAASPWSAGSRRRSSPRAPGSSSAETGTTVAATCRSPRCRASDRQDHGTRPARHEHRAIGRQLESHRAPPVGISLPAAQGCRCWSARHDPPDRPTSRCAKGTVSDRSARVAGRRPISRWATPSTSRDRASPTAGRASTPRGSGFGRRSRRHARRQTAGSTSHSMPSSRLPRRPAACRPG